MRLDAEIVSRGILPSRERAKEKIKSGEIQINGRICLKPSADVGTDDEIVFTGEKLKYAGRGGLKLERASDVFGLDFDGIICLDIGASSGGFTDCMLQRGAERVYAVEVGHGQLAEKLVNDSRVINMEKTDIRNVSSEIFEKIPQFVCADVSFISLKLIIPHIYRLTDNNMKCVLLIKPQFEAGRSNIGKNGIVKSLSVHETVIDDIIKFCMEYGFCIKGLCPSPVKGGSGNTEYLLYIDRSTDENTVFDIKKIVSQAMH
jgi:23S rRNA (cytidine1920-2'-O)/16S rRNA (cytidine1409-2'-O)-methyltransferase